MSSSKPPPPPYAMDAFGKTISEAQMNYHGRKHRARYLAKLKKLLKNDVDYRNERPRFVEGFPLAASREFASQRLTEILT